MPHSRIKKTGIVLKLIINKIETQSGTCVIEKSIINFLQRWINPKDFELPYGNFLNFY